MAAMTMAALASLYSQKQTWFTRSSSTTTAYSYCIKQILGIFLNAKIKLSTALTEK